MVFGLFTTFFKIGMLSFGGGYAMLSVIQHEVEVNSWMSMERYTEIVGLAGMAPGPIATNSATLVGYETAGVLGAISSTLGMVLPSLLLIIVMAAFFYKIHHKQWVKATFYGLKPVVTGLIIYAAIHFGMANRQAELLTWHNLGSAIILILAVVGILRYRMHPLPVIVISGLLGIAFFS
ncbi:chromate transporter [Paenibacillus sp. N1-5-1-14]|uniref:chromate transporter n=1 Tax=Paenibacillus radicibacter TaxID=2972488 RepID=UPI002158F38A|nr:chromate transporter [Paenibacillus radicibacter]MCR8641669.1 chromate transporter [Paenibacillus radicibacter]